MKMLLEETFLDDSYIREATNSQTGEKDYFIEGIFMQAEKKNRNGRIYPKKVLVEATNRLIQDITPGLVGEMYHPSENGHEVNWERACIKILELKEDGNNIVGKAKVLKEFKHGKILYNLLKEGVQVGVSSRGFGELKESGGAKIVQPGFFLKTIDCVQTPSASDAIMTAVMESKEWVFENGVLVEKDLKKMVDESVRKRIPTNIISQKIFSEIAKSVI